MGGRVAHGNPGRAERRPEGGPRGKVPRSNGNFSASSGQLIPTLTPHTRKPALVRESDAYRVIFSEADFLPGLIVDRYNDLLSFQVLTQAIDSEPLRQAILSELAERLKPFAIVERVDPRVRELEQLAPRASGLVHGQKDGTVFSMNGVRFHFDAVLGQKTGAFLAQRENYAAAQRYARREALE